MKPIDRDLLRMATKAVYAAEKLAPVFEENEWKWVSAKSEDSIPTEDEISANILYLLQRAKDEANRPDQERDIGFVATGRVGVLWVEGDDSIEYTVFLDMGSLNFEKV